MSSSRRSLAMECCHECRSGTSNGFSAERRACRACFVPAMHGRVERGQQRSLRGSVCRGRTSRRIRRHALRKPSGRGVVPSAAVRQVAQRHAPGGTRHERPVSRSRRGADDVLGGTIMRGKTTPSPVRDSIQTLVAIRQTGQWKLAAFQNTRRRSMGPGIGSVLAWTITDWLWTFLRRKSEMEG